MRLNKTRIVSALFASAIIAVVGSDITAFGQGRGRGGDRGHDRGKAEKRGPDRGDRNRGGQRPQMRPNREVRFQQMRSDQNARRQQQWNDQRARQQHAWSDRNSRMQQMRSDRNSRIQQQRSVWNSRRPQVQPAWTDRRNRSYQQPYRDDRRPRGNERRRDSQRWNGWPQRNTSYRAYPVFNQPQYRNYGQWRSSQVHRRNAIRREMRRDWREDRRDRRYDQRRSMYRMSRYYQRNYQPRYNVNYAYYGGRDRYREQYYIPDVSYIYAPQPRYVQPVYSTYYAPQYDVYQPYQQYDDGYYGGGSSLQNVLAVLPIGELVSQVAGDSFVGEMISGFLTQGYDQGYNVGEYARSNGYSDYQPMSPAYSYAGSYSTSIAENRRIYSEGYEQGYRDAMERRDYELSVDQSPDLVSLLVGNVLNGI